MNLYNYTLFSWYRFLCDRRNAFPWRPGPSNVSPQIRVAPYLLKMSWDGWPLYHHSAKGWGYLVPVGTEAVPDDIDWYNF